MAKLRMAHASRLGQYNPWHMCLSMKYYTLPVPSTSTALALSTMLVMFCAQLVTVAICQANRVKLGHCNSFLCLKSRTSNKRCEIMSNRGPSFCGNKECFRFAFWNERGLKHEHLINQQRSFKDYIFRNLNYNQSKQYAVFN